MGGIYQIRNLKTDKVYVGSAISFSKRWNRHKYDLRNQKHHSQHLQNSWNKHNEENFVFEILEECSREQLIEREQYWLDKTQSYCCKRGYNICPLAKSSLGRKFSEDHKRKLSEARRKRVGFVLSKTTKEKLRLAHTGLKKGNKHPFYGQSRSLETKEKIRRSLSGDKSSNCKLDWLRVEEIRQKYIPRKYPISKLAIEYGVSSSTIKNIVSNRTWKLNTVSN